MQISLNWLNELVNIKDTNLNELIDKLTLGGFEVEEIIELEINSTKQIVLDISTTANRADSLSMMAMAAEIATLLDKPLKVSEYFQEDKEFQTFQTLFTSKLTHESNDSNCSTLLGIMLDNIHDFKSPNWLQTKLKSSNIEVKNDLSDFQNYIVLEMGYPFEFYDYEKIHQDLNTSDFHFTVKASVANQEFLASNDCIYKLDDSILTVQANQSVLSIAGIIQAKKYMVSDETKTLLIECSIFNGAKIRQQSRKLGLRTERSARYEKSINETYLLHSLYRLIQLLKISNPDLKFTIHTSCMVKLGYQKPIVLRQKTIHEILGPITGNEQTYISSQMISKYFDRLNFKFDYNEETETWEVFVPNSRVEDLKREIDLVEEIGRLHGFNNFLTSLPKLKMIGKEDFTYQIRKKVTTCLINLGFNELINYSLVKNKTLIKNSINLINPLIIDYSSLRSSILPSLLETAEKNLKQKNLPIAGFEYGHVFNSKKTTTFEEEESIAGIFGSAKNKLSWDTQATKMTWFEAKGKITQLFNQLNLTILWKPIEINDVSKILHPYRSADLYFQNGKKLGIFGQINPLVSNKLNLSNDFYLFEFCLDAIQIEIQKNPLVFYKPYVLYPKIIKNVSFILKEDILFEQIQQLIYLNGTQFLTEIVLMDEYKGQSIPIGHKSFCIELIFQSQKTTLENKKIDNILKNIETLLYNKLNATFRN